MSISCAMKDPKSATVREFQFNGKAIAVLTFSDGADEFKIHTAPRVATAVAIAFNFSTERDALEDAAAAAPELNPCPFCGGEDAVKISPPWDTRADIATAEVDALRAEVKRLREALKFYAPIEIAGVKYVGGDDAGWRATAALAEAKP